MTWDLALSSSCCRCIPNFLEMFHLLQIQEVLDISLTTLDILIVSIFQVGDTLSLKTGGAYYNGFIDNLTFCVKLLTIV